MHHLQDLGLLVSKGRRRLDWSLWPSVDGCFVGMKLLKDNGVVDVFVGEDLFLGFLMVFLDLGDVQYRLTPKRSN